MTTHNFGIYGIYCKPKNKWYIGNTCSSRGFDNRWYQHKSELRHNKHHIKDLQLDWCIYGSSSFEFIILEVCYEDCMLIKREQAWMDYYRTLDPKYGYNLKSAGRAGKHSEKTKQKIKDWFTLERRKRIHNRTVGKKLSEEHKQKIRETAIRLGIKPPSFKGGHHTKETKQKMREKALGHKYALGCRRSIESIQKQLLTKRLNRLIKEL